MGATGWTEVRFFHIAVGAWLVMKVRILPAYSRELQSLEIRLLITSKFRERHTGRFESAHMESGAC